MAGTPQPKTEYEKSTTNNTAQGGMGRAYTSDETTAIRNYGYQEEIGENAGDWFANLFTTDYFWNQNRSCRQHHHHMSFQQSWN